MQGDQSVELADKELALSEAMDKHFESENCNGVLIFEGVITDLCIDDDVPFHNAYQFTCKKCSRVFQE